MEAPKIIDLKRSIDLQYVVLRIDTFNQMLGADKRRLVMEDVSCASEFEALDEAYSLYKANEDAVSLISVDLRSGETKTLYTRRQLLAYCGQRQEEDERPTERPPYTHGHGF